MNWTKPKNLLKILEKYHGTIDINAVTSNGRTRFENIVRYCNATDVIQYLDKHKPDLQRHNNVISAALESGNGINTSLISKLLEYGAPFFKYEYGRLIVNISVKNSLEMFKEPDCKSILLNTLSKMRDDYLTSWLYNGIDAGISHEHGLILIDILANLKAKINLDYSINGGRTLLERYLMHIRPDDQTTCNLMINILANKKLDFSIHKILLAVKNPGLFDQIIKNSMNLAKAKKNKLSLFSNTEEGRKSISGYLDKLQKNFPDSTIPNVTSYIDIDDVYLNIHALNFDSLDFLVEKFNLKLNMDFLQSGKTIFDIMIRSFKKEDILKFLHKYQPDLSKQNHRIFDRLFSEKLPDNSIVKELISLGAPMPPSAIKLEFFNMKTSDPDRYNFAMNAVSKWDVVVLTKWLYKVLNSSTFDTSLVLDIFKKFKSTIDFNYHSPRGNPSLLSLFLEKMTINLENNTLLTQILNDESIIVSNNMVESLLKYHTHSGSLLALRIFQNGSSFQNVKLKNLAMLTNKLIKHYMYDINYEGQIKFKNGSDVSFFELIVSTVNTDLLEKIITTVGIDLSKFPDAAELAFSHNKIENFRILIQHKADQGEITADELMRYVIYFPERGYHDLFKNWSIDKIKNWLHTCGDHLRDDVKKSIQSRELSLSSRLFGPHGFFTSTPPENKGELLTNEINLKP